MTYENKIVNIEKNFTFFYKKNVEKYEKMGVELVFWN